MNLFTLPAGIAFLDALADGVLSLHGGAHDPMALARVTVLVPTRRSARALVTTFAKRMAPGTTLLLPRIVPIGDVDEDALAFDPLSIDPSAVAPAISVLRRQLLLAREIAEFDARRGGHGAAAMFAELAATLGDLIDEFHAEGTDLAALPGLAPRDLAEHWQETLSFLELATQRWPGILKQEGAIDPAQRRDLLMSAMAQLLVREPDGDPVIAAGSTGSQPATAALLRTIASLPRGAVVLPGLDLTLDGESFDLCPPTHPQFGLKQLLARMGATRAGVRLWPHPNVRAKNGEARRAARERLIAEALRPPETTHHWQREVARFSSRLRQGFDGLELIEVEQSREEALVIALAMRETLESDGATAALVTADRMLARQVAAELRRWDLSVDDSAGLPLMKTPVGALMALALEAVKTAFAPVALLALIKNRLVRLGHSRSDALRLAHVLDRRVMRGPRPAPGFAGLRVRLASAVSDPVQQDVLAQFLARIETAMAPLAALGAGTHDIEVFARAHAGCLDALTRGEDGQSVGFAREAGEAASSLLAELASEGRATLALSLSDYALIADHLARARAVRPRLLAHPRLSIWGPLEARMLSADLVIIGGLNEGVWPRVAAPDPWLSRPMREALGLSQPERRIGQSAHDFAMLANAPRVLMTRAEKSGNAPTHPSRLVLRLKALAKSLGDPDVLAPPPLAHWASMLDTQGKVTPDVEPMPTPPIAVRPREFSVTEIETLLRDPYAVYAQRVLGLYRLDDIDAAFDARLRGNVMHRAIESLTRNFAGIAPSERAAFLMSAMRRELGDAADDPSVMRFWLPRLERAAAFFVEWDETRRATGATVLSEVSGEALFDVPNAAPLTLRGRADRIEVTQGGFSIFDYKSGRAPTDPEAKTFSPQLQLLALLALSGGLAGVAGEVGELGFLSLSGGPEPGKEMMLKGNMAEIVARARQSLIALIASYDDPAKPYESRRRIRKEKTAGDYDHLARAAAWANNPSGEP